MPLLDAQPTNRQARTVLTDALIVALRERPQDFSLTYHPDGNGPYTLKDSRTNQRWWIANGYWFFKLYEAPNMPCEERLGGWNRTRAYWAYLKWRWKYGNIQPQPSSLAQQAGALWRANQKQHRDF
jgi:hypothetical protein